MSDNEEIITTPSSDDNSESISVNNGGHIPKDLSNLSAILNQSQSSDDTTGTGKNILIYGYNLLILTN